VNALLPGIIETDIVRETGPASAAAMGLESYDAMIGLFCQESSIKRPNRVEEVAAVAVLLASDAGRNMTGCLFPIDGGTMPY
jgi:3-hydroxybutyrate dehydrogenase